MKILINASNLNSGGGLQVANSICRSLLQFKEHCFIVVLSDSLLSTKEDIKDFTNVEVKVYNIKNSLNTLFFGRDVFLDNLVEENNIDIVLTIFGPSRWNPRCLHLSGFALSFLVIPESPYFSRMKYIDRIKSIFRNRVWEIYFKRSTNYFFTENPFISRRLEQKFNGSKVFTVTNYYNQIFDQQDKWKYKYLPEFNGTTLLTIANSYPHKNLEISIEITKWMILNHPDFNFRFVFTIDKEDFPMLDNNLSKYFLFLGTVDNTECPSLYEQCDIAFQPTLIESFTATYPEAMRMSKPNVTVDLAFARGLCGEAALYYDALSAKDAAQKIYEVAHNAQLRTQLIEAGHCQLKKYDTYNDRAIKLIKICENLVNTNKNIS